MPNLSEATQRHCRDRAFYTFGTSRLFERRAKRLGWYRNLITFFGIGVPLIVGGTVLSFGIGPGFFPYLVALASSLMLVQLILSLWSLVARWDERHSYAIGSVQANTKLHNQWKAILERPPNSAEERIRELDIEDQRQEQSDIAQDISYKEKRFAMRATLFDRGLSCETCGQKPKSMKPVNCDTCGNF